MNHKCVVMILFCLLPGGTVTACAYTSTAFENPLRDTSLSTFHVLFQTVPVL